MTKARIKRIKCLLINWGITQRDLAIEIGKTYHVVNKVILGKLETPEVRKKIAVFFDESYKKLWGEDESA